MQSGHRHQGGRTGDGDVAGAADAGWLLAAAVSSGLADVVDVILDKGLVVDAFVRVSLVGIELLTVDARIVIASVDTYLRFAHAVGRLDVDGERARRVPELIADAPHDMAKAITTGVIDGTAEALGLGGKDDGRRKRAARRQRGRSTRT
jgi:gas vesicle structural protein